MEMTEVCARALETARRFCIAGEILGIEKIETGHINSTFILDCGKIKYTLQTINTKVFTKPVELMENFRNVTEYLRGVIEKEGGDPDRETLTVVQTLDGMNYFRDEENKYWRMYIYIDNVVSYQSVVRPILFENSAKAFGRFQKRLSAYPADTLHETIVKFHDTVKRYHDFEDAVARDKMGRAKDIPEDIAFYLSHGNICGAITEKIASGEIPLRVTHNDTKLNNILMDEKTDEAVCIIDLDTVMPGSALYDFGDSIRFGASSAAEDEPDLSKVHFCPDLFEAYTRGYLSEAKDALNETEKDLLPMSAILMTLECGMRFLADYLDGDVYFAVHRDGQNLDRARTQKKLVADMEAQLEDMKAIVAKYR